MTDTHAMAATPLTRAFARRPGAGSSRDYLGHLFSFLADSGQTNGSLAIIEVTVRKGLEPPPHTHSREDEMYYVLDGRWSFDAGGEPFAAEPGSLVFLPRGVAHSFAIDGDSRDFETKDPATVKATVMAQLEKRRKGILLFHDIQPSTAHGINDILDALKAGGFKVVHMVPKAPATTLADYDAKADRELAHRKLAVAKQPLASRSLVWPQTDAGKDEAVPWMRPQGAADTAPKKTDTAAEQAGIQLFEKSLQP